jgi:hypothetical protein
MQESTSGLANKGIERLLELSAEAHIRRRSTPIDSPAFHYLTGTITAYGKALALLVALEHREMFFSMVSRGDWSQCIATIS